MSNYLSEYLKEINGINTYSIGTHSTSSNDNCTYQYYYPYANANLSDFTLNTISITDLTRCPLKNIKNLQVKSIKFDKKFTTVTWEDGTTTRVGCMLEDEYNKYEAFCAALAKRIYGSTSSVKHLVDTKDEQIEIDKQRKEREARETAAKIRKARKDRIWIKKRAKEIAREKAAQELAEKMMAAKP